MDIELAVDAMEMASYLDHVVLFSGDGDFRRLTEALQRTGLRVTVVSTIRTQPPMIADELRRQADTFLELNELSPYIAREHRAGGRGRRRRRTTKTTRRRARRAAFGALLPERLSQPRDPPAARRACVRAPPADCPLCPRLAAFRAANRRAFPDWHNAPVASFGDPAARLLIVGLAPGLRGANRTGRPFTGDHAGEILYATLLPLRLRARRLSRRTRRRPRADRLPDHQRRALRAAREPAARRARSAPAGGSCSAS